MKKYIIVTDNTTEFHAGSKARKDVETITQQAGFHRFVFLGKRTANKKQWDRFIIALLSVYNWIMFLLLVDKCSYVIIQYPHYPIKTYFISKTAVILAQRVKSIHFTAFIHDINSIREVCGKANLKSDQYFLSIFDSWICHNESMKKWMIDQGYDETRIISLGLFDYLTDYIPDNKKTGTKKDIIIAGSLKPEKCQYVYKLLNQTIGDEIVFHLYGEGFCRKIGENKVIYHGAFVPEELPSKLINGFGLVWDGPDLDTCAGNYGSYLRINNPHKVSLYLAAEIPIIIWKDAALTRFIQENRIGIAIDSIQEIPNAISRVTDSEYAEMQDRIREISKAIRAGKFTKQAISSIIRKIDLVA